MKKYEKKDIDDYLDNLTEEQTIQLLTHCNRFDIKPDICAWYTDLEDLFEEFSNYGYSRTEARKIFHGGLGEFKKFKNGEIVRLVI